MFIEDTRAVSQSRRGDDYHLLKLSSGRIAPLVRPGQFVHLRVPGPATLRRPFSVFKADKETLSILYKAVGSGTMAMARIRPGDEVNIIGPLGNGFPDAAPGTVPVLVAGGYGAAALFMAAERARRAGLVFIGASAARGILCAEDFKELGWPVHIATEDGSAGFHGLVTDAMDKELGTALAGRTPELFVCGPMGLLKAVADRVRSGGPRAWLSLDRHMGCGVGVCLACVQKVRNKAGGWKWARVCVEGPVFDSRDILWEGQA